MTEGQKNPKSESPVNAGSGQENLKAKSLGSRKSSLKNSRTLLPSWVCGCCVKWRSLVEFPKISPVEWLFKIVPQRKLVGVPTSPAESENHVCCSFCILCVCFSLHVDFLKNLNAWMRFFEKSREKTVVTLGLGPATKARWWENVSSECKRTRNLFRVNSRDPKL